MYRTAFRITGQAEDAEDVLQTVFLQVLRFAVSDELANPGAYLRRLAVNASLNVLRQRRRRPSVSLDSDGPTDQATRPGPSTRSIARDPAPGTASMPDPGIAELRDRLRVGLALLSPRSAEIFALRYLEGYSNRQIAELLETSESSIGVTLHRARLRLREELAPLVTP